MNLVKNKKEMQIRGRVRVNTRLPKENEVGIRSYTLEVFASLQYRTDAQRMDLGAVVAGGGVRTTRHAHKARKRSINLGAVAVPITEICKLFYTERSRFNVIIAGESACTQHCIKRLLYR